jgi:prepilin signal peptidase PulO-like enzyme (type II secretory pathway)
MMLDCPYVPAGLAAGALIAFHLPGHAAQPGCFDYGRSRPGGSAPARDSLTFFSGILFLVLADGFLFGLWQAPARNRAISAVRPVPGSPLLLIIVADLKTRIIPDQFILALLPGGVLLWVSTASGRGRLGARHPDTACCRAAGRAGPFRQRLAGRQADEARSHGHGRCQAAGGLCLRHRLKLLPFLFCLAFLTAALVALPVLVSRLWRRDAGQEIAFGPYIALATLLLLWPANRSLGFGKPTWTCWREGGMIRRKAASAPPLRAPTGIAGLGEPPGRLTQALPAHCFWCTLCLILPSSSCAAPGRCWLHTLTDRA